MKRLHAVFYIQTSLRGRTVRRSSTNHLGGVETTATAYSHTGKPLMERHTHTAQGKPAVTEVTARTYDGWDRPLTVKHSVDGAAFVTVDSIAYDAVGRVASRTTGGMETAAYTYNVRSWPTRIAGQRFTERLCYNGPVEGLDTSRPHRYRWNGTVAAIAWKTAGETRQRGYSLMYDGLDRLTAAYYGEGAALGSYYSIYDGRAAYDDMGNPTWIYRKSPITLTNNRPSSPSDRLRLEYDGNRLVHVTDSVTSGHSYAGAFHFADGANTEEEYEYDDNGNMTKDLNRGITGITYNVLNLPSVIQFTDNSYIEYTYGADGQKLRTQYGVQPGLGPLTPADAGGSILAGETAGTDDVEAVPSTDELSRVDYCGNMVYDRGERKLLLENGFVTFDLQTNASSYHFYLRDHLGNNRVVMAQNGTVEQVTHYYPFGGVMRESTNPGLQPYKYGGKELDRTSGLDAYDFGARMYFADRMQWGQMDPLCEKYYDVSPYAYCANNPIRYIDPNGREIWVYYYDEEGQQQSFQYTVGMQCDVDNSEVQTIVSNLNTMHSNESGGQVIDAIIGSITKFGFMQADTHSEGGEGFLDPQTNIVSLNDVSNTLSFAEETFHIFQSVNNQGGTTAVNEVEAKLFSAKMNYEIEAWSENASYQDNLSGLPDSPYATSMTNLFYLGYNDKDYKTAVNNFFSGSLGGDIYKEKLGYKIGTVV